METRCSVGSVAHGHSMVVFFFLSFFSPLVCEDWGVCVCVGGEFDESFPACGPLFVVVVVVENLFFSVQISVRAPSPPS